MNDDKVLKAMEAYLRQSGQMSIQMGKIVSPILKLNEQLQETLQPLIKLAEPFQETIKSHFLDLEVSKICESLLNSKIASCSQIFTPPIKVTAAITSAIEEIQQTFQKLPQRMQEALILMGENGWYLDPEMALPALWDLQYAITDGELIEIENALTEYFQERVDAIEQSIVSRFPAREKLIKSAFNAHRRREYELSIPVLFAQTDGICKDAVNQYLFIKDNGKPQTAIFVKQVAANTYRAAILSPLAQNLPVTASGKDRPAGFDELNRHMVLHGESLDYGTETNSLKAISLINYVSFALSDYLRTEASQSDTSC